MATGVTDMIMCKMEEFSIADSDLEGVVCCLDMVAKEKYNMRVELHKNGKRCYPDMGIK